MTPSVGYTEMRDSGIKGIGEIPAIWKVSRVHNLFFEVSDRYTELKDDQLPLLAVSEYYGVAERAEKIDADTVLVRAETLEGYKKCKKGDIVSNIMLAWKSALGQSPMDGIVSPAYCVYRPREGVNSKYYHYLFRTKRYADIFRVNSTGLIDSRLRLYSPKFFVLQIPVPSYEEQSAIAAYLDTQCAKIDEIIAEAKASIEDYQQWKASIIYEAVTKGLDPDVEMKDSGIEWIGEIPKEWKLRKLFKCFALIGSGTTPKSQIEDYYAGNISWLQSGDINGSIVKTTAKHINKKALEDYSALRIYGAPFIAIAMYGASIANTSIVVIDACTNQACCVLSLPKLGIDYKYMFYAVLSSKAELLIQARGGTQPNISQEIIKQLRVPIPPMREQTAIAAYLDAQCAKIDELSTEKQSLIADLEAYKKSLIYEVVTGKRRVC